MKCLFCGEFYEMMMIKIITLLFFREVFLIHFYNDNDCVKAYMVKYLWAGNKKVLGSFFNNNNKCNNTHIYVYIYILHGSVCDPGFHTLCFC